MYGLVVKKNKRKLVGVPQDVLTFNVVKIDIM
jgi:hypothetical protein